MENIADLSLSALRKTRLSTEIPTALWVENNFVPLSGVKEISGDLSTVNDARLYNATVITEKRNLSATSSPETYLYANVYQPKVSIASYGAPIFGVIYNSAIGDSFTITLDEMFPKSEITSYEAGTILFLSSDYYLHASFSYWETYYVDGSEGSYKTVRLSAAIPDFTEKCSLFCPIRVLEFNFDENGEEPVCGGVTEYFANSVYDVESPYGGIYFPSFEQNALSDSLSVLQIEASEEQITQSQLMDYNGSWYGGSLFVSCDLDYDKNAVIEEQSKVKYGLNFFGAILSVDLFRMNEVEMFGSDGIIKKEFLSASSFEDGDVYLEKYHDSVKDEYQTRYGAWEIPDGYEVTQYDGSAVTRYVCLCPYDYDGEYYDGSDFYYNVDKTGSMTDYPPYYYGSNFSNYDSKDVATRVITVDKYALESSIKNINEEIDFLKTKTSSVEAKAKNTFYGTCNAAGTALNVSVTGWNSTIDSLVTGNVFTIRMAGNINSYAVQSLNVNGSGAKRIYKTPATGTYYSTPTTTALVAGDMMQYGIYHFVYDGTYYRLLNPENVYIKEYSILDNGTALSDSSENNYMPVKAMTTVKYIDGSIVKYSIAGEIKNTTIPDAGNAVKIEFGNSVTSIGNGAFVNCYKLASVIIPNSITSIKQEAFLYCSGLTSVIIPDSVTSIGWRAFTGCSGLTSVTIGNSVTSIGVQAFYDCSSLTSITIPDSVTHIEAGAFNGCSGLKSVTISDSITSIEGSVFANCSGLTSITIPNSVTSIGNGVFYKCSALSSITSLRTTAPTVYSNTFGNSNSIYTGRDTYSTGNNVLYIPQGATGYDSSYWLDPLQDSTKCGFHIEYI